MPLAISDDHEALAEVVGAFSASHQLRAATRAALEPATEGLPADLGPVWEQMAKLGWLGLHLPEEHGGSGFGMPELAVVVEALGAVPAHGPLLSTVVASAVVAAVGTPAQQAALLPGLADGSTPSSVAVPADGALLLGGRWARLHLVTAGPDDLVVVSADDVTVQPVGGLDPTLGLARLEGQAAPDGEVLAGGRAVARRVLRALVAAEASGGAHTCLEVSVAYAKVREQFGRAIGSFQAVKHHLADMVVRAELATAAAWDAARTGSGAEADLAAAVAVVVAGDAYDRNARMQVQLHGGIGFTWEHDAHLFLRRAAALRALVGPAPRAEEEVQALLRAGVRSRAGVELPPEAEEFRRETAAFLARYEQTAQPDRRALLVESGYLVPHWPQPWGRDAGPVEQLVIDAELAGIEIPELGIGGWVLLTLSQTGSPEQVERWIGPGLRGERRWCQLFSEPGAGSDAAAVATKAVRVDGGWRVTGQKVWTSDAQNCDRGLATVRTDPDASKHAGITAVVIDLTAAGVTVRPLREISGESLFNEVFLDDVFVPAADVVGEPGAGWAVARATLGNERITIGRKTGGYLTAEDLVELHARHAAEDIGLAREVGVLLAAEQAIALVNVRAVERALLGAEPSAAGNLAKLAWAEHVQAVSELALRIAGVSGVADGEPGLVREYLFDRCVTIAGGTSEVSRNVIAERMLGLPREAAGARGR
jgi:alkylation response protein AidB-like acyl-CoA dehydrogenase